MWLTRRHRAMEKKRTTARLVSMAPYGLFAVAQGEGCPHWYIHRLDDHKCSFFTISIILHKNESTLHSSLRDQMGKRTYMEVMEV